MPRSRTSKRNDLEGSLEVLPSGKFRYRADLGAPRRAELGVARISGSARSSKAEALASYRAELSKVLKAGGKTPLLPTFGEYVYDTLAGPYTERRDTAAMSPGTWALYETIYRTRIELDPIGEVPLDQVTSEHVEQWIRSLRKLSRRKDASGRPILDEEGNQMWDPGGPLGASSKRRYAAFLSGVFTRAVRAKLIRENPVHVAEKPPVQEVDFRILTRPEVVAILALADRYSETHYTARPRFKAKHGAWMPHRMRLVVLLGLHGLGVSEMAGLRVSDFDGKGFDVARQARRTEVTRTLKTKARRAWVPADPLLLSAVAALDPLVGSEGYVIPNTNGGAVDGVRLEKAFASMVKGTPFAGMVPYDLRHTFAMRLLEEGVDVRTAAEMMRHSVEVFLRHYVRSRPELKEAAIARLRYDSEHNEARPPTRPPTRSKRDAA